MLKKFLKIFSIILFLGVSIYSIVLAASRITAVRIVPDLDISRFAPYKFEADITGNPISVTAQILGINAQDNAFWNYYVDGTGASESVSRTMTKVGEIWETSNVYPDSIYPEIFFATSAITWNNAPQNMSTWRRNYHIMKFDNNFTTTGDMSFWIEINATPVSTQNSSNLLVYLVQKNALNLNLFNSDWRNNANVELVGTLSKDSVKNHIHTANSSHHLIALTTNANGKVGTKDLDINDEFWIVLYQDSVNVNRGWNLKYHSSDLCTNTSNWYIADRSGGNTWNTPIHRSGCPDTHVHLARRSGGYVDGAKATITADFGGSDVVSKTQEFSFGVLPNLPPNQASFISPIASSVYDGGAGEVKNLNISWNEATDANNDTIYYTLFWQDSSGNNYDPIRTLVTNTTLNSYTWNITAVDNGNYRLSGYACDLEWDVTKDSTWLASHCSTFTLNSSFTIAKATTLYSLSNIQIVSDNIANSSYAAIGDKVTLTFTSSGVIVPTVVFYSGGNAITNVVSTSSAGNNWTAEYIVNASDTKGAVSFEITASNLDNLYFVTSNESNVIALGSGPSNVVANPVAGTYSSTRSITLSSDWGIPIRYTTDLSNPTCASGTLYTIPISISVPTTLKTIACDEFNQTSSIGTFEYQFEYTLIYTANSNGSIVGITPQTISYGLNATQVTAIPNSGYMFSSWSDDITNAIRTDLNITSNLSVSASFVPIVYHPQGSVTRRIVNLQQLGKNDEANNLQQEFEHLFSNNSIDYNSLEYLLVEVQKLKNQLANLQTNILDNNCKVISNNLYFGLLNDSEVKCLQKFLLNQGNDIYNNKNITGNFLKLTKAGVIKFQEKYFNDILKPSGNLKGTGYVGYYTKMKINELLSK